MATTKSFTVRSRLDHLLDYVMDAGKTENPDHANSGQHHFVTGINCAPETAYSSMSASFSLNDKPLRVEGYHIIQSFAPGEADAELVHRIGIETAERLWGERFQVVIASHLNTQAPHNHIVVCSTSFIDGKRFHSCKDSYRLLRETSDELCRKYNLSVIENPEKKSYTTYVEHQAEREGKPTWKTLIKADVDDAIEHATSTKQFIENLKALGYEVKTGKDISVRPPGKERFMRLARNLGSAYAKEAITERVLAHYTPRLSITRPRATDPKPNKLPPVPKGSIVALYRHYCYLFGYYKNQPSDSPRQRIPYVLREEMRKFDSITEGMKLLNETGIKTDVELAAFQKEIQQKVDELTKERQPLYRIAKKTEYPETAAEAKQRIAVINEQLKPYRKKLRQCKRIFERSVTLEEKIRQIEKDTAPLAKRTRRQKDFTTR